MKIADLLPPSYPTLRRVIVNTKTDKAFRGVLWQRRGKYLVLRETELLKQQGKVAPLDGEVVIESSNVDFIQVI